MNEINYIEGIRMHDPKVLRHIYKSYAKKIEQLIRKNGGTKADAKDVFHDALMVVYQKIESNNLELIGSFYAYLYKVCFYLWDKKRKKNLKTAVTIESEEGLVSKENIEIAIFEREKQKIFEQNFQKLGDFCQQILELFFAEKTMTEIAKKLDLKNEHTARTRKYRCQNELKKLIQSDNRFEELK